ncbi:hypothetical protein [Clostridium sp. Marseille-Q7071]
MSKKSNEQENNFSNEDISNNFEKLPEDIGIDNNNVGNEMLGSGYSEYITRTAGKVYLGDETLTLNGKTKKFSYGVNVYVDYTYRAYEDRYGDARTDFSKLHKVTSTKGMGVDAKILRNYTDRGGYLLSNSADSFKVKGHGTFTVGLPGFGGNLDVPYQQSFDCGDGSYVDSSNTPPR